MSQTECIQNVNYLLSKYKSTRFIGVILLHVHFTSTTFSDKFYQQLSTTFYILFSCIMMLGLHFRLTSIPYQTTMFPTNKLNIFRPVIVSL